MGLEVKTKAVTTTSQAKGIKADLKPGEVINFSASESNGTIGRISVDNTTDSSETLIIVLRK